MIATIKSALSFWTRMWWVWKSNIYSVVVRNVVDPLLFVFAFGFGLGAIIDTMDGLPYLMFVVPGMMAQTVMFVSSFETTVEAFVRFNNQRTWQAIMATPVSLRALLLGEVLWAATRAMLGAIAVVGVGLLVGGAVLSWNLVPALLMLLLGGLCFAAFGIMFVSFARSFSFFSYTFTFWITPMFVFCGVFFPPTRFPEWVQALTEIFPMKHLLDVLRPLVAGQDVALATALPHVSYLVVLTIIAFEVGVRKLQKRMFD